MKAFKKKSSRHFHSFCVSGEIRDWKFLERKGMNAKIYAIDFAIELL